MSKTFVFSVLAVLMVLLVMLSRALQPAPKGESPAMVKKQADYKAEKPLMEKKMMVKMKEQQKTYQEYKKQGKLPKPDFDPKDDWYRYQAPGAEGIKQLEKTGNK